MEFQLLNQTFARICQPEYTLLLIIVSEETMRFIIREQEHETPRSAGLLRYQVDGALTGAVEEWR